MANRKTKTPMRKYVHIKCKDGRLHLEWDGESNGVRFAVKSKGEKGIKMDASLVGMGDDLTHPIPSHVVGNIIRAMCGITPIPNKRKFNKHEEMGEYVKLWKEIPQNQEIEKIADNSFVKYMTPNYIKAMELIGGTKEDKPNSRQKNSTKLNVLDKNGAVKTIECDAKLNWKLFRDCFFAKGVLGLFEDFFSKYIKDFSYEGDFNKDMFELSKYWYGETYKAEFLKLISVLKEDYGLTENLYGYTKIFLYNGEDAKIGVSATHPNTDSRLLNMHSPFFVVTLNAELVVPFDMDNQLQAQIYNMLCDGGGMSRFLGSGCAYTANLDKKTNRISLENDGFQKISEEYIIQHPCMKKVT